MKRTGTWLGAAALLLAGTLLGGPLLARTPPGVLVVAKNIDDIRQPRSGAGL